MAFRDSDSGDPENFNDELSSDYREEEEAAGEEGEELDGEVSYEGVEVEETLPAAEGMEVVVAEAVIEAEPAKPAKKAAKRPSVKKTGAGGKAVAKKAVPQKTAAKKTAQKAVAKVAPSKAAKKAATKVAKKAAKKGAKKAAKKAPAKKKSRGR